MDQKYYKIVNFVVFTLLSFVILSAHGNEAESQDILQKQSRRYPTLKTYIAILIKKYGEDKVGKAFEVLDNLPMGQVLQILLVKVDEPLAKDIKAMQEYAQNSSNKELVKIIARIVAGDESVAKDVFEIDRKLVKFTWYRRIRARIILNLDKFVKDNSTK